MRPSALAMGTKWTQVRDLRFSRYSITSSARMSTDGGMVRRNAFAVLRLMTRRGVTPSTGRSRGIAPRNTFATSRAACMPSAS